MRLNLKRWWLIVNNNNSTTFNDAFSKLADGLVNHKAMKIGSFWEFLRDTWSLSFEKPELFSAWHVGRVAEDVEWCLQENLNYVAVLPRFHFKSTVLGHAFSVWKLLKSTRDSNILYLSYSDTMSRYHISEINKTINRNPVLKEFMINRSPKADFSFRYYINGHPCEILHGGLFSFKRGLHTNGLIADDILRDPENALNMGQLDKVTDHFFTESLFIPLKDDPVIVLGTPMLPGDLLDKLKDDDRFFTRTLPALDPEPGRRVLLPELYSEEWLLKQQKARPKSFASEFLLVPHLSSEAFFEPEAIKACENEDLINYDAYKEYDGPAGDVFAGFDVGKRRHPSHVVLFKKRGDSLIQIHQAWLDNWSYSDQVDYLNTLAETFNIKTGYIDNTRGELEDRGLKSCWKNLNFTQKSKRTMATIFDRYVQSSNIELLLDTRQTEQILCVNNELKAPEGPMGHGDSFFSIAMAMQAAFETSKNSITTLGNVADWFGEDETSNNQLSQTEANLENRWDSSKAEDTIIGVEAKEGAPNPKCTDVFCNPSYWVKERNLCLYCSFRGK